VTILDDFRLGAEIANDTELTDELLVDESGKFKELTFRKIKGQDKRFRRKILCNKLN